MCTMSPDFERSMIIKMDTKILLENGTNELEVLEFVLDGNAYGINVGDYYLSASNTCTECTSKH